MSIVEWEIISCKTSGPVGTRQNDTNNFNILYLLQGVGVRGSSRFPGLLFLPSLRYDTPASTERAGTCPRYVPDPRQMMPSSIDLLGSMRCARSVAGTKVRQGCPRRGSSAGPCAARASTAWRSTRISAFLAIAPITGVMVGWVVWNPRACSRFSPDPWRPASAKPWPKAACRSRNPPPAGNPDPVTGQRPSPHRSRRR